MAIPILPLVLAKFATKMALVQQYGYHRVYRRLREQLRKTPEIGVDEKKLLENMLKEMLRAPQTVIDTASKSDAAKQVSSVAESMTPTMLRTLNSISSFASSGTKTLVSMQSLTNIFNSILKDVENGSPPKFR